VVLMVLRSAGNEPHDAASSNEELWHLCQAVCLSSMLVHSCSVARSCSFDTFDVFNFFDLDILTRADLPPENSTT
jgi:hypothetical protein